MQQKHTQNTQMKKSTRVKNELVKTDSEKEKTSKKDGRWEKILVEINGL